jgi:thioredoxin-like negative regulator of GroEL
VDVDDNDEAFAKYEIDSMPTLVFLRNGVEFTRFSGGDPERLQQILEEN